MGNKEDFTVGSVLKYKGDFNILDLADDKCISEAYSLIANRNGIQAVPIYRFELQSESSNLSKSYYGMLTAKELLKFILSRHLIDSAEMIGKMLISEVALQIKLRDCRIINREASIKELIEAFKNDKVGVLVPQEESFSFLAPVDLMRFLNQENIFQDFEIKSSISTDRMMTVRSEESALVAFERLISLKYNSLGIINSSTHYLISNISVSDFYCKNLSLAEILNSLKRLVIEFLNVANPGIDRNMEAYVAHPGLTGMAGLKKLLGFHVHQLWLVDSDNHPKGLITFDDILKELK
jgi:hypothetical protein